jgi:hypothetical protein
MRSFLTGTAAFALMVVAAEPAAAVKKAPYPQVSVELAERFVPDAAFERMRAALTQAVERKDAQALFGLVGPTFVWTLQGGAIEDFDMGRDALHNFKVVFGFREKDKDADGGVQDGPYWETLAGFAADGTFYKAPDAGNLVCGPMLAGLKDDKVFDQARKKIETAQETADWYFTLAETSVAKAPGDTGPPVAKLSTVALPILQVHPPTSEGQTPAAATHLEVLLPSGKTGWIKVGEARPLYSDRLCYARTPQGDWKIAAFDQNE